MRDTKPRTVVPGDPLAVIEEFEGGKGTYLHGEVVRSTRVGEISQDMVKRSIGVAPFKLRLKVPVPQDEVVGQVETVQGNIANLRIHYLNGERNKKGFTGMILLPQERATGRVRTRRIIYCKPGDLVRAQVVSTQNAIIHLALDGSRYGVVYASCSVCGSRLAKMGGGLKCVECGNSEDRKLAEDFGSSFNP